MATPPDYGATRRHAEWLAGEIEALITTGQSIDLCTSAYFIGYLLSASRLPTARQSEIHKLLIAGDRALADRVRARGPADLSAMVPSPAENAER